ncbi:MAG: alpha/beta fold hydrolase [Bacteroidales bacterium]|nr:alpha/beta fold hydrolase [Bacteroidales bacterium]
MLAHDYIHKGEFYLEAGGVLPNLVVRYHTSADATNGKKIIWICHALTANSNPEDWWGVMVGPGKFFDTDKYFIVCANIIGSCYGTTAPVDYESYKAFPAVTFKDVVRAYQLVCQEIGLKHIDFLIGSSNGGFQALEWAVSNPDFIKNLCLIATSPAITPMIAATNETQRMAVYLDPTFSNASDISGGAEGLAVARANAMVIYRCHDAYYNTQQESDVEFLRTTRAASYQRHQGEKMKGRFNAYAYCTLLNMLDTHNVARGRGDIVSALGRISAKTLCAAIDTDFIFPRGLVEEMASNIKNCSFEMIHSIYGHDGFMLEKDQLIAILTKHFSKIFE